MTVEHDDEDMEDEGRSASGSRWPRQETLALIKLRSDMDANFRDSGLKGPLWEEVSRYVIVHEVQADFFPSFPPPPSLCSSSSSSPPPSSLLSIGMTIERGDVCVSSVPSIFACVASLLFGYLLVILKKYSLYINELGVIGIVFENFVFGGGGLKINELVCH